MAFILQVHADHDACWCPAESGSLAGLEHDLDAWIAEEHIWKINIAPSLRYQPRWPLLSEVMRRARTTSSEVFYDAN